MTGNDNFVIFCGFFLFPLPKLPSICSKALVLSIMSMAGFPQRISLEPDRIMGPLSLSRIEIFLRMLWLPLDKRCADAASGHIIHNISKVRSPSVHAVRRFRGASNFAFSMIRSFRVRHGILPETGSFSYFTGRSRHQACTLYDVLKSRRYDLL